MHLSPRQGFASKFGLSQRLPLLRRRLVRGRPCRCFSRSWSASALVRQGPEVVCRSAAHTRSTWQRHRRFRRRSWWGKSFSTLISWLFFLSPLPPPLGRLNRKPPLPGKGRECVCLGVWMTSALWVLVMLLFLGPDEDSLNSGSFLSV